MQPAGESDPNGIDGRGRSSPLGPGNAVRLIAVLGVAAIACILVARHAPGVNGPAWWFWIWRRQPAWPFFPLMAAAALPFVFAQVAESRQRLKLGLALLMAATFALEIASISQQPMGVGRIGEIVGNSVNGSYYSAAKVLVEQQDSGIAPRDWLSLYPQLLQYMQWHARFKPPGLVLYYVAVQEVFGFGMAGKMFAGILIGLAATLAVPATYLLVRRFTDDRPAAWCGASFMALCPSLILFIPQFDQVYPTIAVAMILLWRSSIDRGRASMAVSFGVVLFVATFTSYTLLMIGFFMAIDTLLWVARRDRDGAAIVVKAAIISLSVCAGIYVVLSLTTGFNPIETYQAASLLQGKDLVLLARPFPQHIPWDLEDFALGSGWIGFVLAAFAFTRWKTFTPMTKRAMLLAVSQILLVDVAAILPAETARLWLLFYPLLMLPIGLELAAWPARHRWLAYAAIWGVMCFIGQNMVFLNMGPGHN